MSKIYNAPVFGGLLDGLQISINIHGDGELPKFLRCEIFYEDTDGLIIRQVYGHIQRSKITDDGMIVSHAYMEAGMIEEEKKKDPNVWFCLNPDKPEEEQPDAVS